MKRFIAWVSFHLPRSGPIRNVGRAVTKFLYSRPGLEGRPLPEIFQDHYKTNYWGSRESVSGYGSTLKYTENLRKEIPRLLEKYDIRSILDAPCGDYNWFRFVERNQNISYIGADIVPELIRLNEAKYGDPNTGFMVLDITSDQLPASDLWMCRDALFHLSNKDIGRTFENLLKSDIKYIFFTSHHECTENKDIFSGDFRLLNLELFPFNFPKPLIAVDDWIKGFPPRKMCLWETQTLYKVLIENPTDSLDERSSENKLSK